MTEHSLRDAGRLSAIAPGLWRLELWEQIVAAS
jgi:hypothetical protein